MAQDEPLVATALPELDMPPASNSEDASADPAPELEFDSRGMCGKMTYD